MQTRRAQDLYTLKQRIQRAIDPQQDKVRLYPLCDACAQKVFDVGKAERPPFDKPDVIVV